MGSRRTGRRFVGLVRRFATPARCRCAARAIALTLQLNLEARALAFCDRAVKGLAQRLCLRELDRSQRRARIAPDPDDDVVIGAGLAAKANFVVIGDWPLLSVGEYQGVGIVGVAQAVEMIGARFKT